MPHSRTDDLAVLEILHLHEVDGLSYGRIAAQTGLPRGRIAGIGEVVLDWPPACLSPNSRVDRRAATSARRGYRWTAKVLCIEAGLRQLDAPGLHVTLVFHPPDRRKRDLDNMLAAIKSGLDGIADATGIDDSRWGLTLLRGGPRSPAHVRVRLDESPEPG